MAPDFLQLGAKWPLESKCYFEACFISIMALIMLCIYLKDFNSKIPGELLKPMGLLFYKSDDGLVDQM